MTSIFIALCFIKTISGSEKCIHGSAIYRTTNDEEEFRELTYKEGTNLLPTSSSKTQRTSSEPRNDKPQPDKPQPDNSKNNNPQNDKPQVNNLLNAISQIKNTGSQPQKDVE
ncbi:23336_t:CDS:2 [Gigaspora rosea]|nr:23336_t:CDS:2 [Gigaspora rosea]